MTSDLLPHYIDLATRDASMVRAYVVQPTAALRGAVVVLQQMDQRMPSLNGAARRTPAVANARPGVGAHARQMAEQFAAAGYLAIAPSTFSRGQSGQDYGYRFEQSRWDLRLVRPLQPLPSEAVMVDIEAAIAHARRLAPFMRVAVVGYCWGGLLAWRAAARLEGVDAAVSHYGGGMETPGDLSLEPRCPVLAHFPGDGKWMSRPGIREFIGRHGAARPAGAPAAECHLYDADYGFMQPGRSAFDAGAAEVAHQRTLDFLGRHLQQRQDVPLAA